MICCALFGRGVLKSLAQRPAEAAGPAESTSAVHDRSRRARPGRPPRAASVGCVLSAALCQLSRKNSIAGLFATAPSRSRNLPERARTNHVAIVLREIQARLSLPGEHAEVIFPEVDHHFVELTLDRHRARELGRLHLPDELLRFDARLRRAWDSLRAAVAARVLLVHRRVVAGGLLRLALRLLQRVVVADDVLRLHRRRSNTRLTSCSAAPVVDALWMQLQVDPFIDAHRTRHARRRLAARRTSGD